MRCGPNGLYETPLDRKKERDVAQFLADRWNRAIRMTPPKTGWDAEILKDGHRAGLVEIKCRNIFSDQYDEVKISKSKIDKAVEQAEMAGIVFILVYSLQDGVIWKVISSEIATTFRVSNWGRIDRDNPRDVSLSYAIPIYSFARLGRMT